MIAERQTLALFGGSLALLLGFFIVLSALRQTHEAHLADRFAGAVELLGRDDLASRLGGIYALEQIAFTSERHHVQMVEILTAYVREHAPITGPPPSPADPQVRKPPADIQACLTVLGRRSMDYRHREPLRLNLARTDLRGANLASAYLEGAVLNGAWLQGANLSHARLNRALLKGAHVERAGLDRASLVEAYLGDGHLEGASLRGATLQEAYLAGAHLEGTKLLETDLRGAFGLTWDQLKLAQRDLQTRFPDYLQAREQPDPEVQGVSGR
jgi:hypothetical protein